MEISNCSLIWFSGAMDLGFLKLVILRPDYRLLTCQMDFPEMNGLNKLTEIFEVEIGRDQSTEAWKEIT